MDEPVCGMLSAHDARVLGCLMEKQMTTPDYYPLTLKALTAACNQKSSRVPVLCLTDSEVGGVVNGLRAEGLVTARMDGRADRYEHHLSRKLGLTTKERAVLCVLMLRSALTLNEIRISTARMVSFDTAEELQALLDAMMERDEPLLVRIPRVAGQREDRYAHLLCGEPVYEQPVKRAPGSGTGESREADERITRLEADVAELKQLVQQLRGRAVISD